MSYELLAIFSAIEIPYSMVTWRAVNDDGWRRLMHTDSFSTFEILFDQFAYIY